MNYLFPFIFSIVIGSYSLIFIKNIKRSLSPLEFFLAIGLGLGISSQLVFYSLILCNGFNPHVVIPLHIAALVGVFTAASQRNKKTVEESADPSSFNIIRFFIVFSPFIIMATLAAFSRPYGNWDAWSQWNLRANFLFRAGDMWQNIFTFQIQEQHPWLLPFITNWGWALLGREHFLTPLILSIIFTVATVGLLVYGLEEKVNYKIAVTSGIFLFSIPFFLIHGTSQYADVIVCYYLLASAICILKSIRNNSPTDALLGGIFLGFLSFTKDEGIASATILIMLTIGYFVKQRMGLSFITQITLGFLLIAPSLITVKLLMAHHLPLTKSFIFNGILNFDRWSTIGRFFMKYIAPDPYWGHFWKFMALGILLAVPNIVKKEIKIVFFFILIFLSIVVFRFLVTTNDLTWHLDVSLSRILLQLIPTMIFMIFYASKSDRNPSR